MPWQARLQDTLPSESGQAAGKAGPLTQDFTEMEMKVRALTGHEGENKNPDKFSL